MRVWLWLVYKLLSLETFLRVHSNSKEVSYLSWQNSYPNLKITCHIKLKFFLWTKLLESLLLAKYLISVAATLNYIYIVKTFFRVHITQQWHSLRVTIPNNIDIFRTNIKQYSHFHRVVTNSKHNSKHFFESLNGHLNRQKILNQKILN